LSALAIAPASVPVERLRLLRSDVRADSLRCEVLPLRLPAGAYRRRLSQGRRALEVREEAALESLAAGKLGAAEALKLVLWPSPAALEASLAVAAGRRGAT
jgi:hypothetical protein